MNELQDIQTKLKEISELLQLNTKTSKKAAAFKLRQITNIASTMALTLEMSKFN